jgi:hypothetical protein
MQSPLDNQHSCSWFFPDRCDHAQSGATIALIPLKVDHGAQSLAAIPDIEPDLPVVLGYVARG